MNVKEAKLKRVILSILLMFLIMIVLPYFISSFATKVRAYTFKSISGNTWNTTEDIAELYNYLVNINKDGGSLPTYQELQQRNLGIGRNFGDTSGLESSFNRRGCLLDAANHAYGCNIICSHANQTTVPSTKGNVINQILYITPDKIEFHKLGSDKKECSIPTGFDYQKLLSVGYMSQVNYETAVRFAQYLSTDKTWQTRAESGLGNKIEFWSANYKEEDKITPIQLKWEEYGASVDDYKYSGIFIFYSIGNGGGQGRVAYRVVREEDKHTVNLNIVKRSNSVEGDKEIGGALFNVKFENIESANMKGYSNIKNGTSIDNVSAGKIIINQIKGNGGGNNIKITLTETKAPDGYKINGNGKTIIEIKQNCSQYRINGGNWINTSNGATIGLSIYNTPLIKLEGIVWLDGQTGIKDAELPNGNKDEKEKGIDGVLVQLYDIKNKKIKATTTTKDGGRYTFSDIEKTNEGYYIIFNYDGINYIETNSFGKQLQNHIHGTQSKASETEKERTDFNNRFKTISAGKSNDGTPLTYDYNPTDKVSTLKVNMDGSNPANPNKQLRMTAKTGTYKDSVVGIDCGLVKKEFDLALGTDVKSAKLELNEKSANYDYAQIMDGEMEDLKLDEKLQGNSHEKDIIYNLYLYRSDYNYRIKDYITDGAIENQVNPDDDKVNNYDNLKELEAYVTYNIILKGQTKQVAKVNQFEYYYDPIFTPHRIGETEIKDGIAGYTGKDYNFTIDRENRKITFISKENTPNISEPNYRVAIDIEFKVNKDNNGGIILKEDIKNTAEILEYSTVEGGLIDRDSAPGNGIKNGAIVQYEDDTDEAPGLNISIKDEERVVEGTVFEDVNKDGQDNDNKPVNDVIVQLIEIKQVKGKNYEYIWQETVSGKNKVKTTARNGYAGEEYTNQVAEDGKYKFEGFIPGNYIIRYIYGDGTTYDITENVKKYNGQDYKSTIDEHYTEDWYKEENYKDNKSVARDNEARRLEVMSYSTTIDKTKGEALERREKEDLKATWMAAETSKLNVAMDNTIDNIATPKSTVNFDKMRFGLTLRPETRLILEKHITGLKVSPNGTGVQAIVDARADINTIINDDEASSADVKGVTNGLAIIKSTRGNRGFWQVATDVEELVQGAELEVEYTYAIKNDSDKDYLSNGLVNSYKNDPEGYSDVLKDAADSKKGTIKGNTGSYGEYLGQYYYNGKKAGCLEVPSRVERLEEALNNDLAFIGGEAFKKVNEANVNKNTYDVNGNEQEKEITTVVQNTSTTEFLTPKTAEEDYVNGENIDYNKTIALRTVLSSSGGETGTNLPSYIAEIMQYSNAAGRRNKDAEPANLSYVHSDDVSKTMENSNEPDEFWGETIIVTKPTGEDKLTPIQITLITIGAVAVVGVGIVVIKKFVLKK